MLKFLSSLKLAVFLIAAIAVIAVLATIFPEADAFHSWTFRILVAAFFCNLSLCTIKLLPNLLRQLRRGAADVPDAGAYECYAADEAAVTAWLRGKHYHLQRAEEDGRVKILARKGRAGLIAPHMLHISILVILVGALCSSFNTAGYLMGQAGQERPFPEELRSAYGDGCAVRILDFHTEYDEQQTVDNWVTRFDLILGGETVAQNVETRVNAPYSYGNLIIYQNSYSYSYLLEVRGAADAEENTTYALPDGQPMEIDGQLVSATSVQGKVYLQTGDPHQPSGGRAVAPGQSLTLSTGAEVIYWDTLPYTVLELKSRHGTYIVFAGFLLATLASFLFLGGRYRELRVICTEGESRIWCWSKSDVVMEELREELDGQWPKRMPEAAEPAGSEAKSQ